MALKVHFPCAKNELCSRVWMNIQKAITCFLTCIFPSALLFLDTDETFSGKFDMKSALIASTFSQIGCHSTFFTAKVVRIDSQDHILTLCPLTDWFWHLQSGNVIFKGTLSTLLPRLLAKLFTGTYFWLVRRFVYFLQHLLLKLYTAGALQWIRWLRHTEQHPLAKCHS